MNLTLPGSLRARKLRIPITAVLVFGVSSLLALTVGLALMLGFSQAMESTRIMLANQSDTLV